MASLLHAGTIWLRHHLPTPGQLRREVVGLGAVLAAAGALGAGAMYLPPLLQVFVGSLVLAALALLARRGAVPIFGPILFYDLVRNARRNRFLLYRVYGYFVVI